MYNNVFKGEMDYGSYRGLKGKVGECTNQQSNSSVLSLGISVFFSKATIEKLIGGEFKDSQELFGFCQRGRGDARGFTLVKILP